MGKKKHSSSGYKIIDIYGVSEDKNFGTSKISLNESDIINLKINSYSKYDDCNIYIDCLKDNVFYLWSELYYFIVEHISSTFIVRIVQK